MNIQAIATTYQYRTNNYCSNTSFNGLLFNIKSLSKQNIGKMKDGIIGKTKVKNINNKKVSVKVEKYVEKSKKEHYAILDETGNVLGEIEFLPVNTGCSKYIWVERLVSHVSPRHRYRNENLGDYSRIGTRLMQIALKRSKEVGFNGNIELFSVDCAVEFYKKIGLNGYPKGSSRYQQKRMYLPEEGKIYLANKYGGL